MKHFSLLLRKILLSNFFYGSLLIIAFFYVLFSYCRKNVIPVIHDEDVFQGTVVSKQIQKDSVFLEVKGKIPFQLVIACDSRKKEKRLQQITVGSLLLFQGKVQRIQDKTSSFFLSSYQTRMARKNLYYRVSVAAFQKGKQTNFWERLKEKIYLKIENHYQTSAYLKTFLLGNQTELSKESKRNYQTIGISHLFALSGMHISFLVGGLYTFFKKIWHAEKRSFYGSLVFLFGYCSLVQASPSILRASLFFFCFKGNQVYDFHVAPYQILLFLLALFLLWNPFLLENVSFLYSFSIASFLILYQKKLTGQKKIIVLFKTSVFSFFLSLPITLYFQYQVNPFSMIYNLFYIPFVSTIVFPCSFLVFFLPFLEPIYLVFLKFLEQSSAFCAQISPLLIFPKLPLPYYLFLFLLFLLCLSKKRAIYLYGLLLGIHFFLPLLKSDRLTMLDVGQGDCFLFESKGKALLVDVGGIEGKEMEEQDASFLIQELKARGIHQVSVVLSHGDIDHAGNLMDFINHFSVTSIRTNLGHLSKAEQQIKALAKQKKIPFQRVRSGTSFTVGHFQFLEINQSWENENDSSAVYFVTNRGQTMLFLGDASQKVEEKLLEEYDFPSLTLLKVGHHGSRTSTSDFLLTQEIQIALISAGSGNRYQHPHQETIKKLKQKKIKTYITSQVGSVEITFPSLNVKTSI